MTLTSSAVTPSAMLTLSIASTPQTLGTVTTSPTGTFSQSFTVPCSVDAGAPHDHRDWTQRLERHGVGHARALRLGRPAEVHRLGPAWYRERRRLP